MENTQLGVFCISADLFSRHAFEFCLVFSPDLFFKGQMVVIVKCFDEFLIKVVFYIGPKFSVQYKFVNQLCVYVEYLIFKNLIDFHL